MKITMTTVMLLIYFLSMGQNNTTDYKTIEIATSITQMEYDYSDINKYRLIAPLAIIDSKKRDEEFYKKNNTYNDKEWEGIKKQMQKNKSRLSYDVYVSKTMDTIYLDIPVRRNNSRLSDL